MFLGWVAIPLFFEHPEGLNDFRSGVGGVDHAVDVTEKLAVSFGIDTKQPVKLAVSGKVGMEITIFEKKLAATLVEKFDNERDLDDFLDEIEREQLVSNG